VLEDVERRCGSYVFPSHHFSNALQGEPLGNMLTEVHPAAAAAI
jgi:hypothetical protein